MTLLRSMTCLFVDLQATGASPNHGRLLELGWCLGSGVDDGSDVATLRSLLVDPQQPIPKQVSRLTGIDEAMLAGAVTAADAIRQLQQDTASSTVMVAHVARYESSFLAPLWQEYLGTQPPTAFLCTHHLAQRLMPTLPSLSLRAVAGHCGFAAERERRSAGHVLATAMVWRHLCDLLERDTAVRTLGQLNDWLQQPRPSAKRPRVYPMARDARLQLPDQPGIYRLCDATGRILYVGKALSLKSRVNSYFRHRRGHATDKLEMLSQVTSVDIEVTATGVEAALLECDRIKALDPLYNIALRRLDRRAVFVDQQLRPAVDLSQGRLFGPFARLEPVVMPHLLATAIGGVESLRDAAVIHLARLLREEDGVAITEAALALYRQSFGSDLPSARQLLALSVAKLRREEKLLHEVGEDSADDAPASDESDEEPAEQELTPELLLQRIERWLDAAARVWLRARDLQSLLCSRVAWREPGEERWRQLTVQDGELIEQGWLFAPDLASFKGQDPGHAPARLTDDIAVYDRMRTLRTEIERLRSGGMDVCVVSRSGLQRS